MPHPHPAARLSASTSSPWQRHRACTADGQPTAAFPIRLLRRPITDPPPGHWAVARHAIRRLPARRSGARARGARHRVGKADDRPRHAPLQLRCQPPPGERRVAAAGFWPRGLVFLLLGQQIAPVVRGMPDDLLAAVNVATAVSLAAALMLLRRMAVTESRATVVADGRGGDDGEHGGNEHRRRPGGELPGVAEQQLDRHGREDEGQPWPQVAQPGGRPGEQEVQRPHAE